MIKAINFLGNTEAPGTISNVAGTKQEAKIEAPVTNPNTPVQDTFVPSAPKTEEAPQADPNDKFVKAENKPEEAK